MTRRSIAALAGAAALLVTAAAPAAADPVTGKVDRSANKIGYQVNVGDDWLGTIPTNLIGLRLDDGTKLGVYCVEIHTDIDEEHAMVERPWGDYPNEDSPFHRNRSKINWVLHHGYPATGLDALAAALPAPPHDGLDEFEAIAATQAAVWHYSDGVDLDRTDPLSGDGSDEQAAADALAVYDFLTGPDNTGIDEPAPALSVDPAERSGAAGELIGPFTVATTGTIDALTSDLPEGVTLTDAEGNPVTTAADGSQLYVRVPEDAAEGAGSFELTASAAVDTGRLFVGENYDDHPTQSLIVATSDKTTLTASAAVDWTAGGATTTPPTSTTTTTTEAPPASTTTSDTPAPQAKNDTENLASTGASVFTPILIGLVLVGAGLGALLVVRRRRNA